MPSNTHEIKGNTLGKLQIQYKGERKYVHGPDIYNAMVEVVQSEIDEIPISTKLSSRKLAVNELIFTEEKLPGKEVNSIFEATTTNAKYVYYIYETDTKMTSSKEYEESDIVDNAQVFLQSKEVIIRNYNRYSVAEIAVTLLKELCNKLITDTVKWIFVELKVDHQIPLNSQDLMRVQLVKNLGTKMIVSQITLNDKKVGTLKFSSK